MRAVCKTSTSAGSSGNFILSTPPDRTYGISADDEGFTVEFSAHVLLTRSSDGAPAEKIILVHHPRRGWIGL